MRVVTRLTGLPADTIRVWERRYGAIRPARSAGRTRRFSDEDIRRLTLLRRATDRGHRIGSIAQMSTEQLEELQEKEDSLAAQRSAATEAPAASLDLNAFREQYVQAILRFDAVETSAMVARASLLLDRETLLYELILPVLREVGERWEAGTLSPAHEHLVSVHIRGVLDGLLRQQAPLPGAPRIVVATPPGEQHELGAALGAMLAATRGVQPIFLGASLPEDDIALAADTSGAKAVLLGVRRDMSAAELKQLAGMLRRLARNSEVWVGLPSDHPARGIVRKARFFTRFEDLDAALTELAAAPARHV